MFSDVDESLRELLTTDLPIVGGEVDIAFERPTREWSGRLSKPTINLFLADIRERTDFRFTDQNTVRNNTDGTGSRRFPARRFDLLYMLTAWTKEPADEHRILARSLRTMLRYDRLPPELKRGEMVDCGYEIYLRNMPPDSVMKPVDLWGVLDNDARPSLAWVATVPVSTDRVVTSPLVTEQEIRFSGAGPASEEPEIRPRVAGLVHRRGNPTEPIAHALLTLMGVGTSVRTDVDGQFVFDRLGRGTYQVRVEAADLPVAERSINVPSREYRIEV